MITGAEMAVVDANAAALGVPQQQLMESSGNAVARVVREETDADDRVAVLAGRGNNGGDAFAAARFLGDREVTVSLLGRAATITTDIARANWEALQAAEVDAREVRDSTAVGLDEPDLIVDAMLGTGISGALREPAATAARAINDAAAPVVSVDVPSGLDAATGTLADDAVAADHVVTFHDTKPGLADLDATVTVADIGIPDAAELFVERGDLLRVERDPMSHKGEHGEVLVIGGGPYTGAPALAAQGALRGGADLVRVACPASVAHEVQGYSSDLIVHPVDGVRFQPSHVGPVMEFAADQDVVVIGPGLGEDEGTLEAVEAFLTTFEGTAVVDADALRVVRGLQTTADIICTPHKGEFIRMGGVPTEDWRERMDAVAGLATELAYTVCVKGPYDVISDGDRTRVNRTGNASMTVGGTGDVLAGITGALACTQAPLDAAAIAANVNGRAGDILAGDDGAGIVASDMLEVVPEALWGAQPD
jgi:hydroxyethylthiazole kinase-like uncharacterized protein yjeF